MQRQLIATAFVVTFALAGFAWYASSIDTRPAAGVTANSLAEVRRALVAQYRETNKAQTDLITMVVHSPSLSKKAQSNLLTEQEIDLGLTPWPGRDPKTRAERLFRQMEVVFESKRLDLFRSELAGRGYIHNPSSEEDAFLKRQAKELPNLVVRREYGVDVLLGYRMDGMSVESCERDGSMLRCTVTTDRGRSFEGAYLTATATRFDGERVVDLPGALISAPRLIVGVSELDIHLPERADAVRLSYRGQ